MPFTATGSRFRFAVGKQTAESTVQAVPAFEVPRYEGDFGPSHDLREHETTDAGDMVQGLYVASAMWGGEVTVPSLPGSEGFLWFAHLGSDTVTGTTPNFTHTVKKAATKPYMTFYNMRPGVQGGTDLWERGVDGIVKAAEIQGTKGEPIKHKFEVIGKTYESGAAAPTPTTIQTIGTAGPYHTMIGSTLSYDFDSVTAAQTRAIESFVIRSEYPDAEYIQTDEVFGRFVRFGKFKVGVSITMILQTYDEYRNTFFGSASGTTLSQATNTGTLDFTFPTGPTADVNRTLQCIVQTLRYEVDAAPAPDIGGDALRIDLTASMQTPPSGEPIQIVSKNSTATY